MIIEAFTALFRRKDGRSSSEEQKHRLGMFEKLVTQSSNEKGSLRNKNDETIFDFLLEKIKKSYERGEGTVSLVLVQERLFYSSNGPKAILKCLLSREDCNKVLGYLDDCYSLQHSRREESLLLLGEKKSLSFSTRLPDMSLVVVRRLFDEWDYPRPEDIVLMIGKSSVQQAA